MKNKSSNQTNMENEFEILKKIQRVDAPPFLYTRILNSIEQRQKEIIPLKWVWAAAASLLIVFALNITSIQANKKTAEPNLIEVFSLQSQNLISYDKK